jgi:nicotinate-nucleotide adenylyltransferase
VTRIPGITELPPSSPGLRIGLFGGSFNPPHEGHRLVALQCLKRLDLDAVWLLVTPGNPLKTTDGLPPIEDRVSAARALMRHPQIRVTGFEAAHGFRYSFEVIRHLTRALPDRRFVWIMGADNLRDFDRWERWREIADMVPIAVYVRPGSELRAPLAKAATALGRYRIEESDARALADRDPPAWIFLRGLMSALSSTAIRAHRKP